MGSPSGSRRNLMMVAACLMIFNAVSCSLSSGTQFASIHVDERTILGHWNILDMPAQARVNAIHAALLPTGKVLVIAGSGNSPRNFAAGSFTSLLWDPQTGSFTLVPTPDDLFCGGHTLMPDGKLLVAGGTQSYGVNGQPGHGASYSYQFDPQAQRYERVADMHHGRWYPTLVGLVDGDALAVSGTDEQGRPLDGHNELYRRDTERWIELPELNRYFPTYPALFLLADGRLFYSGSNAGYGRNDGAGQVPGIWNLTDNSFASVDGLREAQLTETSASVLLPPAQDQRVMVLGGGGIDDSAESTARTDIVDLRSPQPHFMPGADLAEPTRYLSAVILPDDTVLTTGGSRDYRGRNDSNNHIARIYDPTANTFRTVAPPQVGRNYHSEALLLPDGRVVTLGSERLGGDDSVPGAFRAAHRGVLAALPLPRFPAGAHRWPDRAATRRHRRVPHARPGCPRYRQADAPERGHPHHRRAAAVRRLAHHPQGRGHIGKRPHRSRPGAARVVHAVRDRPRGHAVGGPVGSGAVTYGCDTSMVRKGAISPNTAVSSAGGCTFRVSLPRRAAKSIGVVGTPAPLMTSSAA